MPEFLWFCPDFCDLVHIKRIIDLLSKQQKNAVLERHPYFLHEFHPDFAQVY